MCPGFEPRSDFTFFSPCDIPYIEKTRTTPYHPQDNGMPEHFNETHLNMLGTLEEDRLKFAYAVALRETKKQRRKHKRYYGLRVREVELKPGYRVLVRNVGLKGKCKLAEHMLSPVSLLPVYQFLR